MSCVKQYGPEFVCPVVEVKIAGRTFNLRLDFNAVSLAEKLTGRSFLDEKIWDDMNVTCLTALFFSCAVQTDPNLHINEVRCYSFNQAEALIDACRKAWRAVNELPEESPRPTEGSETAAIAGPEVLQS